MTLRGVRGATCLEANDAAEMREAAAMLGEMGLHPGLSEAIAEAHDRRARAELSN